jgi:nucleotide-binding universal stress UspA family protein
MTRTHLVLVNEGHNLQSGFEYVCETFPDDRAVVMYVDTAGGGPTSVRWDESEDPAEEWIAGNRAAAEEAFDEARALADDHSISPEMVVAFGNITRAVEQYCTENDIDTVVVGIANRSAFSSYVVADDVERIVNAAPVPVVVV